MIDVEHSAETATFHDALSSELGRESYTSLSFILE